MNNEKVFMGLDLGTNSCGWAVTDQNYHLLKYHGQSLWGVRLFDEGNTAADRRIKRSNRRRLDRKKWRIDLLQDLFSEEISQIDPEFFLRLNHSFFQYEDKKPLGKYTLFNDKVYSDKDYFKEYPTIYHLRNALMHNQKKLDIRLIYLTFHHIIKYRGHFLLEGSNLSFASSNDRYLLSLFSNLCESVNEHIGKDLLLIDMNEATISQFIRIVSEGRSPRKTSEQLNDLLNKSKDKFTKNMIGLLSGLTVKSKDIFINETLEESDLKSIIFSDEKYENDIEPNLFNVFSDGANVIIDLKKIYDWMVLKKLLGNSETVSQAMVGLYQKHQNDLRTMKKIYRDFFSKEDYFDMFRSSSSLNNYSSYVRTNQTNNKKSYVKGCNREDFIKALKKKIESIPVEKRNETITFILSEIESNSFLPKLSTKSNASLPYQLHLHELETILNNNQKFYPFFNQKDSTGYSFAEKVKMLMTFRIPYYVGPMNTYHSDKKQGHSWVVRKENGPVLPWNYSDKIDEKESQKAFILRMTNKCTYLKGKDVLPKYSLLYSEFSLLNEINKLQINGELISYNLKMLLIEKLFKKQKKVSQNSLIQFLKKEGIITSQNEIAISGIDGDIKNTLISYVDFTHIFGSITYEKKEMIESIIFYITLLEDKNTLRNIIKDEFHLPNEIINKIIRLPYSGFGRLSREFLETEAVHIDEDGVVTSIISLMRENNYTLMEALHHPMYQLLKKVEDINQGYIQSDDPTYQNLIDPLDCSPSIKRSIWQTVKIVKEIKKTTKKPINRFFVEVTREKQESRRSDSRKQMLEKIFASAKEFKNEYDKLPKKLNDFTDAQLRSDKLFLYFLQLGRCAYSNASIDLDQLNTGLYDIDHIIPRALLKDDSIDNRVLVKSELNKMKGDQYPYTKFQHTMDVFWRQLKNNNLMSEKKYGRLSRKTELSENEMCDFINRQLVFTNQSVKALIDVLKIVSPESEIIYSKAGNVSDFRQEFELLKSRELNDLHHAHDAYLNIVVGNVYHSKFGYDVRKVIQDYQKKEIGINTKRIFDKSLNGAWVVPDSIATVRQILSQWDPLITKMTYDKKGQLYDETVYPKNSELFPVKEDINSPLSNPAKYGGYKSLKNAYFVIVESKDKKGHPMITIENIPVIYANRIKQNPELLMSLLTNEYGLIQPVVLVTHLKINTLIKIRNTYALITGTSESALLIQNASQMYANKMISDYIRLIVKHRDQIKKMVDIEQYDQNEYVVSESKNEHKPDLKITKEMNLQLFDMIINHMKKPIFEHLSVSSTVKRIEDAKEVFIGKNVRIQAFILYEMLHFIQTNATMSDLSYLIEKASYLGKNRINKNITSLPIEIIDQSITGLKTHVRWKNSHGI